MRKRTLKSYVETLQTEWTGTADIKSIEQYLAITNFRGDNILEAPSLTNWQRALVLAPHQDDETIGCGGLLLRLRALGAKVNIIYLTDGAQHIDGLSKDEVIATRRKEAEQVVQRLGASSTEFGLDNRAPRPTVADLTRLQEEIRAFTPDLILLPWFLDAPSKHRMVNDLLALLNHAFTTETTVWGYQVHNHLLPNILVDISEVMAEKVALLEVFKSQNEHFLPYPHLIKGLNAFNSRYLRGSQYVEVFFGLPATQYLALIADLYFARRAEIYHSDLALAVHMDNLSTTYREQLSNE